MRKGQIGGYIFMVGMLIVIGVIVAVAMAYITDIRVPSLFRQEAEDMEEVTVTIAESIEECWISSNQGRSNDHIHCSEVHVTTWENITADNVTEKLVDDIEFEMETIYKETQADIGISFNPNKNLIEVNQNQICDPSDNHNCTLSRCKCETVCKPDYDDIIDDSTDLFGCVKEEFYQTNSTGEECSFNWECAEQLKCSENYQDAVGLSGPGTFHCCPSGFNWDVNEERCLELG